ncbi:MAG: tRNA epoxyqueuosine(34) reductase QueG [Gemmatimonadetes bacterium]|nr:tRNA epoxyqueuosine(34) reductase QueG [Gemmatimonadota bacterium]
MRMTAAAAALTVRLKREATRLGFDRVGIAAVHASEHAAFYRAWLDAGCHGEMDYLARPASVERRLDPSAAWPAARSAVVVAHEYFVPDDDAAADPARGVLARYARGRDYHKVIKKKLLELLTWLEREVGRELPLARAYVDTGPVLERELARRAGLGWFGKNTMLIHPRRGSYFFLGALLLDCELEYDRPFEDDHCGRCTRCLEACPTGALLGRDANGAPIMDARRCISYLTIEQRGPIPRELRPSIGNRIFGCDICQEVCPFNAPKFVRLTKEKQYLPRSGATAASRRSVPGTEGPALVELMRMGEAEWDVFSRASAIRRATRAGFLRNVAVALGNWGSEDAVPALRAALQDPAALVRGHAAWALGRIGSAAAQVALEARQEAETDAWVRAELELALAVPAAAGA